MAIVCALFVAGCGGGSGVQAANSIAAPTAAATSPSPSPTDTALTQCLTAITSLQADADQIGKITSETSRRFRKATTNGEKAPSLRKGAAKLKAVDRALLSLQVPADREQLRSQLERGADDWILGLTDVGGSWANNDYALGQIGLGLEHSGEKLVEKVSENLGECF
jgi:hypothetical protein